MPSTPAARSVPPIKLLGARRALAALALGGVLGPAVGAIVSGFFLAAGTSGEARTGLLIMSLFFGWVLGPMLTLATASLLATAGFTDADLKAVGRSRLLLVALLGCGGGIIAGFGVGLVVAPSDAIVFMLGQLAGMVGALWLPGRLILHEARRRLDAAGA